MRREQRITSQRRRKHNRISVAIGGITSTIKLGCNDWCSRIFWASLHLLRLVVSDGLLKDCFTKFSRLSVFHKSVYPKPINFEK